MDAMWQFELQHKDKIVVAGSLRKDDKETKNGSVLLLNVKTGGSGGHFGGRPFNPIRPAGGRKHPVVEHRDFRYNRAAVIVLLVGNDSLNWHSFKSSV